MTNEEIVDLFTKWEYGRKKIFLYKREGALTEYLLLTYNEDQSITTDYEKSTYYYNLYNRDHMTSLLRNGSLKYVKEYYFDKSLVELKTGGCECGAWVINSSKAPPNLDEIKHSDYCPLSKSKWSAT